MILLALNVLTLSISIALFLLVTIILVALLLFVKNKLTPSGEVEININEGEKTLKTEMGNSLLSTLGNNQIFLPSACGGGGSCGMCKCQVLEGGGSILPTETGFFSRKQQQNNWRLACQVKVKDNLKIQIPEEILGIKKWECEVVSNHNVASFIKEFVVKLPEGEQLKFKSGSYI
ncbi:MAG: 2Fe-2S iron-sulfur cluster-binding protein, partial [Bacteroidales bacterium]